MFGILGETVMTTTDEITSYHVRTCLLDYSCMRTLILLSGDVIVDGFNWSAGVSVQQPHILNTYRLLIQSFRESAQLHLRAIQPIQVSMDSDTTAYKDTAPSYF